MVPEQRSITQRVDDLAVYDREEADDLLLNTLHQFLLAKTPPDIICQRMGISPQSLKWLREKLRRKIKEQAKAAEPFDYLAPMLAELEEAKAAAWREVALAKPGEWSRRISAIRLAMTANAEMSRVLQIAGAFDNAPMRAPLSHDEGENVNVLKELAQSFLQGRYAEPSSR